MMISAENEESQASTTPRYGLRLVVLPNPSLGYIRRAQLDCGCSTLMIAHALLTVIDSDTSGQL